MIMDLRQYSGHIFRESFFETNPLSRMCHRFRLISNGEPYLTLGGNDDEKASWISSSKKCVGSSRPTPTFLLDLPLAGASDS